jgi:hypothetical protein
MNNWQALPPHDNSTFLFDQIGKKKGSEYSALKIDGRELFVHYISDL